MPYIFPKRELRDGDVLDPKDLNEDFMPAAELVAGNLDAHNFKTSMQAATPAAGAFYRLTEKKASVDPGFGLAPPFSMVQPNAQAYELPNDGSWRAIPLNVGGDTSIDLDVGSTSVWIEALVQYALPATVFPACVNGIAKLPIEGAYSRFKQGARVQFAIRLDGTVLPWTQTGHEDPDYASPRGEKAAVPYRFNSANRLRAADPGPRVDKEHDVGMIGLNYEAVRLGDAVDLSSGSHRFELVARRLPRTTKTFSFSDDDVVTIYSRKMALLSTPVVPRAAATFVDVEVSPFDSEDLVDQAAMDASVKVVRDKLNALEDGAVARGALRPQQLPASSLGLTQGARAIASPTSTSAVYPGWANLTTFTGSMTGTGWYVIDTVNLSTSVTVAAASVSDPVKVLVVFDLHVFEVERTPSISYTVGTAQDIIAFLGVQVSNAVPQTMIEDSLVFFNSNNVGFREDGDSPDNMNKAAYTIYEVTSPGTYDFTVCGCVVPTITNRPSYPTITTTLKTKNGAITALQLRS